MRLDAAGDFVGEAFAVDRQRRSGRHLVDLGGGHDEAAERAHFLVEQADRIGLGVVGAEAVRADHLGKPVAVVRGGGVAAAAHFAEADLEAGFGELPRGFGAGEAAADDVNVVGHARSLPSDRAARWHAPSISLSERL